MRKVLAAPLTAVPLPESFSPRAHLYGEGDPSHEPSILQTITAKRREDVAAAKLLVPEHELRAQAEVLAASHGAPLALRARVATESAGPRGMAIAAEFKRASPSKGDIAVHLDAAEQGLNYFSAGAAVLSVLTEKHWFKGSLEDMRAVRIATQAAAEASPGGRAARPAVLRKDFIIDEYQLAEARAYGADTVLLIVAILEVPELQRLIASCRDQWGMEPLVEVHTLEELEVALACGARVLGVNNRNLHTFKLDLATTERVADRAAQLMRDGDRVKPMVLALSGISGPADVDRYRSFGVEGVLVGEALMRAADPAAAIEDLLKGSSAPVGKDGAPLLEPALVKVCGVTDPADALGACRAGASLIGVIFAPKSKRCVTEAQAEAVVAAVRAFGERDAPVRVTVPAAGDDAGTSNSDSGGGVDPGARLRAGGAALRAASIRTPLVVGVFQDQPAAEVLRLALASGVDLVQYHGAEDDVLVNAVGLPALRVLHLPPLEDADGGSSSEAAARAAALAGPGGALRLAVGGSSWVVAALLDTAVPSGARGGTGLQFDWSTAAALGAGCCPVLVAGGLDGATVGGALAACGGGALGVDASSGLEAAPGVKDQSRVEAFVAAAKAARPQA